MTTLIPGIRRQFPLPLLPWDDYYMAMAQTDFFLGRFNFKSSKAFFIRKAPFGGSYAHLGGLHSFIRILDDFRFTDTVATKMLEMGYREEFIAHLQKEQRIKLQVHSVPEGSVVMPHEPATLIEGCLGWIRIAEGIMLPELNFPTLSITKWTRVVRAAGAGTVLEFARRRAQDSMRSSLYAHLAGCHFSSNADIRTGFDIDVRGTMGHEWIQSFGDEFEAFDKWLEINPDRPVLLVDTVDTLKSGVPNAIKAFMKHRGRIEKAGGKMGIRIDSGDLAYLTIEARRMLDEVGLRNVLIYLTNDLDEHSITSIREQLFTQAHDAGLDPEHLIRLIVWGCGTVPGTCSDQPSLGGVAKLVSIDHDVEGTLEHLSVIKLAKDNPLKTSIPGSNRSTMVWDGHELVCCLIHGADEIPSEITAGVHPDDPSKRIEFSGRNLTFKPRHMLVYDSSSGTTTVMLDEEVKVIRDRVAEGYKQLHWTQTRLQNPHIVKVSLSQELFLKRKRMIDQGLLMDRRTV